MWQKHLPIGHEYKTVYNVKEFFKHYGRGCKGEDIFEVSASFWRSLFHLEGTPNQTKNLLKEDLSVSAERFEYNPLMGTLEQKTSLKEDLSVSAERFELSTNGLKGRCSAVELRARQYSGLHSNMGDIHRQRKRT
jgi:hypothetical protein